MRRAPAVLAAVLLLLVGCGEDRPSKVAGVPIENFAEVAPGVYRGAQPDSAGFQALKDLGVKTIVNLRSGHDDAPLAAPQGIDVVGIPMSAGMTCAPPSEDAVKAFFAVVADPARRPVFFHCAQGCDRTGTMCALFRIEVDGWTPERALEEMRAFGWHDGAYGALADFVRAYKPRGLAKR